jgi:RNA polymerase sigma factor (sigma-70 family)
MSKEEQEQIIEDNLWLVEYVARKYKSQADWSDMVSAGRYGLVRGINKYDPSKGKPSTYLIHWVRAEILRCLYEDRNVHLPWNRINKYIKEREKTQFSDGIYPRFEVSLDRNYITGENEDSSGEKKERESSNLEFKSSLSSDFTNNIEIEERNEQLYYAFESSELNELEKKVIIYRFGLYGEERKTLKQIGDMVGYSPMGIQKIEKKGLSKLYKNREMNMVL